MLKVLSHFRDLCASERRMRLYKVFCVVTSRLQPQCELEHCSIGADLLTEILMNWEQGTRILLNSVMLVLVLKDQNAVLVLYDAVLVLAAEVLVLVLGHVLVTDVVDFESITFTL